MFSAYAGGGAFLDGEPIKVSGVTDLAASSMGMGYAHRLPLAPYIAEMEAALRAGIDCRTLGSGALDLGFVAAGRLDATYYGHINLWDVAGGLAILAEAGGIASDFMAGDAAHQRQRAPRRHARALRAAPHDAAPGRARGRVAAAVAARPTRSR